MGDLTTLASVKEYTGITGKDALLATMISAASAAIETFCDRTFKSTSYRELYNGTGERYFYLNQSPVTVISYVSLSTTPALQIVNGSSDAYNATVNFDGTTITLTIYGGANDGDDTLTAATYTLTTLVAAINALGKDWSATVAQSGYANWSASELLKCYGISCFDTNIAYMDLPACPEEYYMLNTEIGRVEFNKVLPVGNNNIVVSYTAGYATIPKDLAQACNSLVNMMHKNISGGGGGITSEKLGDHTISYNTEAESTLYNSDELRGSLSYYMRFGT